MKYIITFLISLFLFSCSGGGNKLNNSASDCEPRWYAMKDVSFIKKILGKKDYKSSKGVIYGKGFDRAFDRNTAQELATANAKKNLLKELSEDVVNNMMSKATEGYSGNTEYRTRDIKRELEVSLARKCDMCFVEKFEDCYNPSLKKWDAYVLVELDFDNWSNDKFKQLLEATALSSGSGTNSNDEGLELNAP